jgi:rare lipoprotein A
MMKPLLGVLIILGVLTACAETKVVKQGSEVIPKGERAVGYKVGAPYQIKGKWYYPKEDFGYVETGIASWYGAYFNGRLTANGEIYDMNDLTAAHKTLQMPSMVRVTNLENGRSLKLRVNDRGPFVDGRIIDVSRRASQLLGFHDQGLTKVKVEILPDESKVLAGLAPGQAPRATAAGISPQPQGRALATEERGAPPESRSPVQTVAYRVAETAPLRHDSRGASSLPAGSAGAPSSSGTAGGNHDVMPAKIVGVKESKGLKDIYVQAGAFSRVDNAETARARLRDVGPVTISAVQRDGHDLFRVRVGPLASEDEADRLLAAVVRAGFSTSRVVHE